LLLGIGVEAGGQVAAAQAHHHRSCGGGSALPASQIASPVLADTLCEATLGFDHVSLDRDGRMSVSVWPGLANCPVWSYWFPLLCWLSPETMRPLPLAGLAGARFVYPVELRYEVYEWCADAAADELLAVLPPAVQQAVAERRALVVLSSAHEGLLHYAPGSPHSGLLLDRLAAFARCYGLSADQFWYVSGNLDVAAEVLAWCQDRNLHAPRGALVYRPRSGHGLEEVSVGLMAYLDP